MNISWVLEWYDYMVEIDTLGLIYKSIPDNPLREVFLITQLDMIRDLYWHRLNKEVDNE